MGTFAPVSQLYMPTLCLVLHEAPELREILYAAGRYQTQVQLCVLSLSHIPAQDFLLVYLQLILKPVSPEEFLAYHTYLHL